MENLSVRDILKLSEYDRLVYLLKKKEYQKDSLYSWALNVFKTDEAGYEENGTLVEFGTVPMLQEEVNRLKLQIKALGCEVPSIESEILEELAIGMKKEFGDEAQTYIYRGFTLERFEEVRCFLIRKNSQQARRNSSQVEIFSEPNPQKIYKLLWNMKD